MASENDQKLASTIANVIAVSEKMMLSYSEKGGCSSLKLDMKKVNKKAWEYLYDVMGTNMTEDQIIRAQLADAILPNSSGLFYEEDKKKIETVTAKCSKNGLDSTTSWRPLITYMNGLLDNRYQEVKTLNGDRQKMDMVLKLQKLIVPIYNHFEQRSKKYDFDKEGVDLVEFFEGCWSK